MIALGAIMKKSAIVKTLVICVALTRTALADPAAQPKPYPVPLGAPHMCLQLYPPEAAAAHIEGTAKVAFVITKEGRVRDVVISESSGNALLDEASVRCASEWLYRPEIKDSEAVERPWQAIVKWIISDTETDELTFAEPPRDCIKYYPIPAKQLPHAGPTVLEITVYNGEVIRVVQIKSSGYAALDEQAEQCVRSWRYRSIKSATGQIVGTSVRISIPWDRASWRKVSVRPMPGIGPTPEVARSTGQRQNTTLLNTWTTSSMRAGKRLICRRASA